MIEKHGKCMLYVTHDGNKNVSDLLFFNGGSGVAAHYEYAPFGALTASTRNSTSTAYDFRTHNPFRFSSEYADDALGLVYYNYRHYEPIVGKWLRWDPLDEVGGVGLNVFMGNRFGEIDILGLASHTMRTQLYINPKFEWVREFGVPVIGPVRDMSALEKYLEWVHKLKSFDQKVDVEISWKGYCTGSNSDWPIIEDVELSSFDVVDYLDFLAISLADIVPFGHKVNMILENAGIEINLQIESGWYLKMSGRKQSPSKSGTRNCVEKIIDIEVIERRVGVGIGVSGGVSIGGRGTSVSLGGISGLAWNHSVVSQSVKLKQCCCPSYTESLIVGGQKIDSKGRDLSEEGRPKRVALPHGL
jgi:RHS repeat-associated protein